MNGLVSPTPFADVNAALGELLGGLRGLLGNHFQGMYLVGSLALGDFDPRSSDIDYIVVTDADLADELFDRLRDLHARFAAGGSPWAGRVEAVYVPGAALRQAAPAAARYPQLEKGTELFQAPLEDGWVFQRISLRDRGVAVAGPGPAGLVGPIDPRELRSAVAAIAGMWAEQASTDPEWLAWLRQPDSQRFVVLTLCRMLFSLSTGSVASKPRAAAWASRELAGRWAALAERSLAPQPEAGGPVQGLLDETVAFVRFTLEQAR